MVNITIRYRKTVFSIDIDPTKSVEKFKKAVSKKTDIKPEHFDLQRPSVLLDGKSSLSDYINDKIDFQMVNVIIKVIVILNGVNHSILLEETRTIDYLREKIIREKNHKGHIIFRYNNVVLIGSETLLSSEVVHGTAIVATTDDSKIRKLRIAYRSGPYIIEIDTSKSVLDLRKIVSDKSNVAVDMLSLQLDNVCLKDPIRISDYSRLMCETNIPLKMVVIIHILVKGIDGKVTSFTVNEAMTAADLKMEIIVKLNLVNTSVNHIQLSFQGETLEDKNTLWENGLDNECTVMLLAKH